MLLAVAPPELKPSEGNRTSLAAQMRTRPGPDTASRTDRGQFNDREYKNCYRVTLRFEAGSDGNRRVVQQQNLFSGRKARLC